MSSECVWSSNITLHEGFAQGLVCNECHNIPKKGYGRICLNNHIYCKRCIEQLIKEKECCTIKECKAQKAQFTESRMLPKVLEHIIDELQVKCPNYQLHCTWNGSFSSLSHHLRHCSYKTKSNNNGTPSRERLMSDNNIIYNDNKKHTKRKYFGRMRTVTTCNKDDAFKSDAHRYKVQKPHKSTKVKSFSCPLKTVGCSHKLSANEEQHIAQHFATHQQKHLMLMMDDYQQKFESLENTVLFLQTQLKFVLNELDVCNQVIESQSKQIEHLNHKLTVNIINKLEKPPKKQNNKERYAVARPLNLDEGGARGSIDIPTPPPVNIVEEVEDVRKLCLSDNKRIASTMGKRTLSSESFIDKLNNDDCVDIQLQIENAVVIDNGSGIMKFGLNTDETPNMFPTLMSNGYKLSNHPKQNSEVSIGYKALQNEKLINIAHNIIENGMISDWNKMEDIWWYIMRDKLHMNPAIDCDLIVMNESLMNEPSNREKITQIMFEQFNVKSFYLCSDAVLSLHGAGKVTGTVVESGYDHTTICPIFEGVAFKSKSISTTNISGKVVNEWLHDNIPTLSLHNMYNNKISKWKKEFVINNIKEHLCFVRSSTNSMDCSTCYALPDGYDIFCEDDGDKISSIPLNDERYLCTQQCIMRTLPNLVQQSIGSCLNDVCGLLYDNICIAGGNTMFTGFGARIKHDINRMMKQNKYVRNYNVNIVATKHQAYQCWKGAAVISSLDTIGDIVMSTNEYNEYGPSMVRRKCS